MTEKIVNPQPKTPPNDNMVMLTFKMPRDMLAAVDAYVNEVRGQHPGTAVWSRAAIIRQAIVEHPGIGKYIVPKQ